MTDRRSNVARWAAYTAAFFVAYFFGAGVFSRFPVQGTVPTVIPVFIALVAAREGSKNGCQFGFWLGLFGYLAESGTGPSLILLGTLIGFLAGLIRELRVTRNFLFGMLAAAGAMVLVEYSHILVLGLFSDNPMSTLIHIAVYEGIYSVILAIPMYPLVALVARRVNPQ